MTKNDKNDKKWLKSQIDKNDKRQKMKKWQWMTAPLSSLCNKGDVGAPGNTDARQYPNPVLHFLYVNNKILKKTWYD